MLPCWNHKKIIRGHKSDGYHDRTGSIVPIIQVSNKAQNFESLPWFLPKVNLSLLQVTHTAISTDKLKNWWLSKISHHFQKYFWQHESMIVWTDLTWGTQLYKFCCNSQQIYDMTWCFFREDKNEAMSAVLQPITAGSHSLMSFDLIGGWRTPLLLLHQISNHEAVIKAIVDAKLVSRWAATRIYQTLCWWTKK